MRSRALAQAGRRPRRSSGFRGIAHFPASVGQAEKDGTLDRLTVCLDLDETLVHCEIPSGTHFKGCYGEHGAKPLPKVLQRRQRQRPPKLQSRSSASAPCQRGGQCVARVRGRVQLSSNGALASSSTRSWR